MFSAYIRNHSRHAAAGLLATLLLAAQSCVREPDLDPREEGREAAVTLRWSPSDMTIQSRALTDAQERHVHSLWVGIYDYGSKKIKTLTDGEGVVHTDGYYITPDAELEYHVVDPNTPLTLHTTSGESYIVAVANPDTNYGISDKVDGTPATTLLELLRQCDTWEKFRSVAVLTGAIVKGTTPNITLTEANMPMVGLYHEELDHNQDSSDPVEWTEEARSHTYIPAGANTLPGTIHLRRLHAHVNFQIIPGQYITVEPTSWQVRNVPYASYLHERPDTDNADRNAGDNDALGAKLDGTDYKACYAPSRTANTFERSDALGSDGKQSGFTFEFYQYENKHTGLDGVTTYNDREEEFQNPEENGSLQNTGIYKSLCEEAAGGKNNMATYVEIQAKVTYYIDANGTPVDPARASENGIMPRLGYAKYVVHLGYCEGTDEAAKARDFNCRRNTRYTYRITINGVDKIRVEAEKEGDTPGAEGDVVDYESNSFYDLDCHYAVFNIQMSNAERNKLYWRLRAPYGTGEAHVLDYNYDEVGTTDGARNRENPFYSWIRFRPTRDENTLAPYSTTDSEMWTLQDLKDVAGHRHTSDRQGNVEDGTSRWYTVFVDEYAYLIDRNGQRLEATEWQDSAWENYVNQPDRTVWMIVDEDNYHLSYDEESLYAKTKYMISQRSIQTYYSTTHLNDSKTALGVEHMNETYGKNLTWNWGYGVDDLSHSNGRWNTWQYIQSGSQRDQWSTILTATTPDAFYPVAALRSTTTTNYNPVNAPAAAGTYYEIIAACMSRNRDLNNNGTIDANELKWYLPAEGKYERIMLGRNALKSWLINPNVDNYYYTIQSDPYAKEKVVPQLYTELQSIEGETGTQGKPNWVHYASSDHRKFYPDEGGSFNNQISIAWPSGARNGYWPWNIRCVRNLGTTFETVTADAESDPVERAYTFKEGKTNGTGNNATCGGVFDASSYHDDCLRANIDTYMPVHPVSDFQRNLIARYFEVAPTDVTFSITASTNAEGFEKIKEAMNQNKPCDTYEYNGDKTGWRLPNQREIMMILNESDKRKDKGETPIIRGNADYGNVIYSCTIEGYGNKDRFAVIGQTIRVQGWETWYGSTLKVRCVRDVTSPTPQM